MSDVTLIPTIHKAGRDNCCFFIEFCSLREGDTMIHSNDPCSLFSYLGGAPLGFM